MIKRLSAILGLILACAGILGLAYTLDSHWAKASDVALIAQRLDEKIASDRADRVQEKIWKIKDRYEGKAMPTLDLQLYRDLTKELTEIQKRKK